jgi:hypothetical protein
MNTNRNLVTGEGKALPFITLPLWQWAASHIPDPPPPVPRVVSHLMRRSQLSPTFAALVASHLGLGDINHD